MPKRVRFLAIVPETKGEDVQFKAYFLCKTTRQLISIQVNPQVVDFILEKKSRKNAIFIKFFDSLEICKIVVKKNEAKKFVAILKLKSRFLSKEIITSFHLGFIVSQLLKIPIEVEEKTMKQGGIHITPELLKASLT